MYLINYILFLIYNLIYRVKVYFVRTHCCRTSPVIMKTCISFFEGYTKKNNLEITLDENFEYKIKTLKEHNEFVCDELFNDYLIYHNPYPFKSNIQNSVFHKYNGHVFVSHKFRDLNQDDLIFFKEYSEKVFKKGKRIYTEPKHKLKNLKIIYKKPGALKIN